MFTQKKILNKKNVFLFRLYIHRTIIVHGKVTISVFLLFKIENPIPILLNHIRGPLELFRFFVVHKFNIFYPTG